MAIEGVRQIDYIEYEKYGPGKFSSNVEEYFYNMSMDYGPDDELGSVDEIGWYGLLLFKEDPVLVDEEIVVAAIVYENSEGFIEVETFNDHEVATDKWLTLREEFMDDEDDE